LGDATHQDIFEFCYPALTEALLDGKDVVKAVEGERARGEGARAEPEAPVTEMGRRTKAELDMPTTIINRGWCPRRPNGGRAGAAQEAGCPLCQGGPGAHVRGA
jgi:hypothetical protein